METPATTTRKCEYNLDTPPAGTVSIDTAGTAADFAARLEAHRTDPKWSVGGFATPPAIGTRVRITFNGLGSGVVESYFVEHNFVGVRVRLDAAPAWHVKQNKGTIHAGNALVFGREIEPA